MQDNLQTADNVETTPAVAPVELTLEQLQQVSGGVTSAVTAGPNDNW